MAKLHYHFRLDKMFANGAMWNHRTLRTLFDPYASEWGNTAIDEKLFILEKILETDDPLYSWIKEYEEFYMKDLNKPHVVVSIPDAIEILYNRGTENIRNEILKLPDDYIYEIKDKEM